MKFIGIAPLAFAVMTVTGAANADPVKLTGVQTDKAMKVTAGQVQRPGRLVLTETQMDKITAGGGERHGGILSVKKDDDLKN